MSCDVLLVNPPWVSKNDNIWNGVRAAMPPLALLSIAAYLAKNGLRVQVLDSHVERLTPEAVAERIRAADPAWIGLTVMTATSVAAHRIARIAREAAPRARIVFGGVHAEALPLETLSNSAVDCVVRGDGEETMLRLAQGGDPRTLRGVSWRDGDQVVNNPAAELETDLDRLPPPAYELVPMHLYYPAIGAYRRLPAINMLMTRGCPGKCTFCNSANTKLRSRGPENVVAEIERLRDRFGIREIQFYDDTFTVNRKNVLKFCQLMVERAVGVSWCAFVRPDCFNEEMARAMRSAGCHQILVGVESGSDEILRNIGKPIARERIRGCFRIAREAGIESRAAFILGNVGETPETMRQTTEYAVSLDPDLAIFNVNTPYPGTQLFEWARTNGALVTEEWSEYELSKFLLRLKTVSSEDVARHYSSAHRTFYLRPRAIWRRLLKLRSPSHARDLLQAFFFIALRRRLAWRRSSQREWVGLRKGDFFDLVLREAKPIPRLTWELREGAGA